MYKYILFLFTVCLASSLVSDTTLAHHLNHRQYWYGPKNARNSIQMRAPNPGVSGDDSLVAGSYYSPSMEHRVGYIVYLPAGYTSSEEPYPVIYYLHGINGSEISYFSGSDGYKTTAQLYGETNLVSMVSNAHTSSTPRDTIIVFVNGGGSSFYLDYDGFLDINGEDHHSSLIPAIYPNGVGDPFPNDWPLSFADFRILSRKTIVEELIPHIDATYNTIPNRTGRAIEGFSMGGGGAWRIALQHPDMFCSTVAYAPAALDDIPASHSVYYPGPLLSRDAASAISTANIANIVSSDLRLRTVTGASDSSSYYNESVAVATTLITNGLPASNISIAQRPAGVGHKIKDLNNAAGLESFDFHWSCFEQAQELDPVASFSSTPTTGEVPLQFDFDATSSSDSDGVIVDYAWDFGDGATGQGISTSHTFTEPGEYTVVLLVIDDDGNTGFASQVISVTSQPEGN